MKKFTKIFKFSLIFFIILFIILPVKQSEAISLPNLEDIGGKIKGALSALGGILGDFFGKIEKIFGNLQNCFLNSPKCLAELIIKALTLLIELIAKGFHYGFRLIHYILALVVDSVSNLNPFDETGGQQPPAEAFFNVLTTFGYILLIFLALLAAFEVLFEENASAVRIIFAIFIAAFLIVFAFTFVKEAFFVVKKIENGIAGSGLKSLGSFIFVTMWPSDPFELIDKITKNIDIDNEFLKSLIRVGGYIFVLVIDMITIILLFVTLFLFIYRYIIIIFLAATSSIAIATLAIPEGKGRFSQFLSGFRYFESWFNSVVRWLLVIPVFVILIIAGNIVRENVFAQLANISSPTAGDLSANEGINLFVQFILIYFLLTIWYIFSINVANNLSRGVAKMAAGIAVTGLSLIGGLAATGLMAASGTTVGKVLTKTGGALEEKVGAGGTLGWRSWVGQKIGKPTREMGEKMLEKRYNLDAAAARSRIKNIDREIAKTTDPTKEKLLLNQFGNLIKQFQNNPYVLKNFKKNLKQLQLI
jgi:hypothetical protein